MLIEDHEMNIRLEMFFVQFDSFAKTAFNAPPFIFKNKLVWFCSSIVCLFFSFFFCCFVFALQSQSASVVFHIPQSYWTQDNRYKFIMIPLQLGKLWMESEEKQVGWGRKSNERKKKKAFFFDSIESHLSVRNLPLGEARWGNRKGGGGRLPLGLCRWGWWEEGADNNIGQVFFFWKGGGGGGLSRC